MIHTKFSIHFDLAEIGAQLTVGAEIEPLRIVAAIVVADQHFLHRESNRGEGVLHLVRHLTGQGLPASELAQVYQALDELEAAKVLAPLSAAQRNRSWEATGLLDLVAGLEAGRHHRS